MLKLVVRRALELLCSLILVCVAVFALTEIMGDPVSQLLPPEATQEQHDQLAHELGFDRPMAERFGSFVGGVVTGDLGRSTIFRTDASSVVLERVTTTFELAVNALLVAALIGIPMGIAAAYRPGRLIDRLAAVFAGAGQAVPTFLVGVLLIFIFSVQLRWLPASGFSGIEHRILPVAALTLWAIAAMVRLTRSGIREALNQPFVLLARAKGLSEWQVMGRHVLRNGMLPVITFGALQLGVLFTGAVVVEVIFTIPGLGKLALDAVQQRDLALVQAVVLFSALVFVLMNMLADVAAGIVDPRIRAGRSG